MRPNIGNLARIKSKFGQSDITLGYCDGSDNWMDDWKNVHPTTPVESYVLVVKTVEVDSAGGVRYPVVSSEYGVGWVYWDELETIDEVQAG